MSNVAALVVDSEYVDGMFRRVCGTECNAHPINIRDYFGKDRELLWTRWYVLEPMSETDKARERRRSYYNWLSISGIRVIVCQAKPINQLKNEREANTCDFEISEGIHLACLKASTVIIATGDGHLGPAIRSAHDNNGCRIEVFCDRSSVSSIIEADKFHFLEDIVEQVDLTRPRRNNGRGHISHINNNMNNFHLPHITKEILI